MSQPDVVVSLGASGTFAIGSPVSLSVAVPDGRFWNAWMDLGVYNFSAGIDLVLHAPGGNVTFTTSNTVTIGGQTYLRIYMTSGNPENQSLNGCAGSTVTVDIEMTSGSGAHSFATCDLTLQPMESLVQAASWQGGLTATWMEGYDTWVNSHLAPGGYVGSGSSGWETAVKIGGAGKGVLGVLPPRSSWLMFGPAGNCFLTPDQNLVGVYKNHLAGLGTISDWSQTRPGGPYSKGVQTLHSYPLRAHEWNCRFWCSGDDWVSDHNKMIFAQEGLLSEGGYQDDDDWSPFQSGRIAGISGQPLATNVRGKTFGVAWMDYGFGLLYTNDTEGAVYWKFTNYITPVTAFDQSTPGVCTPWPNDPGVSTGISGQVCGMARNNAGVLVAIIWDDAAHGGSGGLVAARIGDNTGLGIETFSISSLVVPALDVPPFVVGIENNFYLVYQSTIAPGKYNVPAFAASLDAGATWS